VMDPDDTPGAHVEDTLVAGAGLCHRVVAELCAREGPVRVRELMERGARFDRDEAGALALTREGGHSARRVVHAADATGAEVQRALVERVAQPPQRAGARAPHGHRPHHAVALRRARRVRRRLRARAARARQGGAEGRRPAKVVTVLARTTVLATGGAGKVYLYTSNPDVATGDGVAMAYRAGAEIANMEFYQFHPTCLYHPHAKSQLVSEALRGEGAILRRQDGSAFMQDHDARGISRRATSWRAPSTSR
jgi:L-aspartate oxidase